MGIILAFFRRKFSKQEETVLSQDQLEMYKVSVWSLRYDGVRW